MRVWGARGSVVEPRELFLASTDFPSDSSNLRRQIRIESSKIHKPP